MSYEKPLILNDGTEVLVLSKNICSPTCEHRCRGWCVKFKTKLDQGTIVGDQRCKSCLQAEVRP